jgi:hypothetical protein
MKALYEIPELEISTEDFIAPENLSIPVNCDDILAEGEAKKPKPKADLDALGF